MKKVLCTVAALVLLSGCTQSTEQVTEITAEITSAEVTTGTTAEATAETAAESTESTAETEYEGFDYEEYFKGMEYFFSYDLDGDGRDEDLFISTYQKNDEICAAFYSEDKSVIWNSTRINRMDSYDIYNYYFSGENGIEIRCLTYLSNEYRCIGNYFLGFGNGTFSNGYIMYFNNSWCSWHWYNSLATREEFEASLVDKKLLFGFYDEDYEKSTLYDTINIKEKLAEKFGYSEKFIGRIEEVGLDVFELENDPFGKKYKFQSGELCCYTLGGENIRIYSRPREIWVGFKMDGHNEENGETEYLISVSSGDGENGTMEFIYTGTENENYAAVYDRCVYASDGSLDRFGPDEEEYRQAANDTDNYLAEHRWEFVKEVGNFYTYGDEWENEFPELIPLRDYLIKLEEEHKLFLYFPDLIIKLFDYNNDGIKDALITDPFIAGQPTYHIIDNINDPQLVRTFGAFEEADLLFDTETEQIVIRYFSSYGLMTNSTSETNFIFLGKDIDEIKHVAFTGTSRPDEYYIEHGDEKSVLTENELYNSIAETDSSLSPFSDFERYKMTFGDDGIFISRLDT